MNRPLLVRALTVFNRFQGRHNRSTSGRKHLSRRWRQAIFERRQDRSLLGSASITGIKFDTVSTNGFSPGDVPLGGGVRSTCIATTATAFSTPLSDSLADRQQTAAGAGTYTSAMVADGHYFIQEEVAGRLRAIAPGPAFYTVDVIGRRGVSRPLRRTSTAFQRSHAGGDRGSSMRWTRSLRTSGRTSVPAFSAGSCDLLVDVLGPANPISASGFVGHWCGLNNGVFNLGHGDERRRAQQATMQYDGTRCRHLGIDQRAWACRPISTANGNNGIRLDFNFLQVGAGTTMELHDRRHRPRRRHRPFLRRHHAEPRRASACSCRSRVSPRRAPSAFANVSSLTFVFNPTGVQDADFEINQIVGANQNNTGFNFGNFPITVSSISGIKYVDSNNNANHDPGELPIGGVIITLTGTTNTGNPLSIQTQTAADGTFSFTDLQPGTYTLTETPPINFIIGQPKIELSRRVDRVAPGDFEYRAAGIDQCGELSVRRTWADAPLRFEVLAVGSRTAGGAHGGLCHHDRHQYGVGQAADHRYADGEESRHASEKTGGQTGGENSTLRFLPKKEKK